MGVIGRLLDGVIDLIERSIERIGDPALIKQHAALVIEHTLLRQRFAQLENRLAEYHEMDDMYVDIKLLLKELPVVVGERPDIPSRVSVEIVTHGGESDGGT